jgi:hypothetical protein
MSQSAQTGSATATTTDKTQLAKVKPTATELLPQTGQ